MIVMLFHLICMLVVILVASQIFTNALEHFGEKINISAGVTGSIFAAIATALPETAVPIIAIVAGTQDKVMNQEISVGAILGAPLMLSTLSTSLMAISVLKARGLKGRLMPEISGFKRDTNFFLVAFFLAAVAMYLPLTPVYLRAGVSIVLIAIYFLYIIFTCKASKNLVDCGYGIVSPDTMLLTRIGFRKNGRSIFLQLLIGLALLLYGAKGFIASVESISKTLQISALLLSLIVIPLATELPEKVNSILWVRKNKDTLGFGNITGAMVFQGSLLPALGILLTPWQPTHIVQTGVFITFTAALWLRLNASPKGIRITALLLNGFLYLLYLGLVSLL